MRNNFEKQLSELNCEMTKMGALCECAISKAMKALLEKDIALVNEVYLIDTEIDRKEREIESFCMKLLTLQQPVANDLRKISSALKMISDMERIGDQASDIAEISEYVICGEDLCREELTLMAYHTVRMVTDSLESYVRNDHTLAHSVIEYDDNVDRQFEEIQNKLIAYIENKSMDGKICIDILLIAKYLERIGDHATNIAEWVEYSVTGEHGKY